ncbi:FAD-dependent monooxygenase [Paenibacillus caseinilyticus]|uniref:2-polyprenyl-6-methoxyphenol hydroxylase n=1 Tax=Paenibacillus mucilaginosus K02 TaxID=997761 RepID=I0BNY6_9BACL|nr:FAD-dependent monooxygenase [Paenibacillus mucilaginosus]AFH64083.2 2-polyprenyl-6-methoxyphenol hydroxylase [Paenibacillus mucilaginosus K02]
MVFMKPEGTSAGARIREAGKRALIIGGGIGGLSAAIALQAAGWDAAVYERGPSLAGAGAGIVLAANAMKLLDRFGAGAEVRARGAAVRQAEIRSWQGRLITRLPVREQALRYGTEAWLIHRAALQEALHRCLQPGTVRFGRRLERWEQDAEGVRAYFEGGETAEGRVLIGADGIRSQVASQLPGGLPLLRYGGFTALRGIARYEHPQYTRELGGGFEAWGPGLRFGFSQIGEGQVFWFAALNAPPGTVPAQGNRKQAARSRLAGWYEPVRGVVEATGEEAILAHDLFDRAPLRSWSDGRVTLLGDAAHPMLPNLGQGGAQAMEDAAVLAGVLDPDDIPASLRRYERLRIPRTSRVVRGSRRMARLMQLQHPLAAASRNALLGLLPSAVQLRQLDWLLGHEVPSGDEAL